MKNSKEKASELVEKFAQLSDKPIQCALILCDELIEDNAENEELVNGGLNKEYWKEVKESILNNQQIDLFDTWEQLPENVQQVLAKYSFVDTYQGCNDFQKELEPLGYTFDYYLNAEPYNLRKL